MLTVASAPDIRVEPWPTERPLFALALLVSAGIWLLAIVTIIGAVYALMLAAFFFVMHLAFIAHVRGSGVRIGPDQFPELHSAVERLSARIGLRRAPDAYLLHGGGMLNALATRFVGSDLVVLYAELIEACGDNAAARDMIIAHELGHLHRGHVRWHLVVAPAMFVPFLGTALSRAREYTCDRYGLAGAGDRDGALLGLTILAAGGTLGRRVNRQAMVNQRADLNTGWMTLGEWLSTHPPLARRMAQLEPALAVGPADTARGPLRALAILALCASPFVVSGLVAAVLIPLWAARTAAPFQDVSEFQTPPPEVATPRAEREIAELAAFVRAELEAGRDLPWDAPDLYERWRKANPGREEPLDPYDGTRYGYVQRGSHFILWSVGPDLESRTADDVTYDSRQARESTPGASAVIRVP
ncbi:MAG TPA: M48 family metallopeptidase [Vicinamibacterales bacterium]|nr:M48 family metallopeptidase [Vicinamibacterales bacterium]